MPIDNSVNVDVVASAGNSDSGSGFVPEQFASVGLPYTVQGVKEAGKIPLTLTYPEHLVFPTGPDARERRHEEMWKVIPTLWPLQAAMFEEHKKLSGSKSVHVKEELGKLDRMGFLKPIWTKYQSEEARGDGRAFRADIVTAAKDCRLVAGAIAAFKKANKVAKSTGAALQPEQSASQPEQLAKQPEQPAKKLATPRTSFYLRVFGVDEALEGGRAPLDLPTWDKVAAELSIAMLDVSMDTPLSLIHI